jgi:two-component system response regulator NreC
MAIRVLIADDHGVLRAGLRALLNSEPEMEVVGEAADGEQTLLQAEELQPDVVLMDLNMPKGDGIYTTRGLKEMHPEINVLILTVHEDDSLLREAIQCGAAGYILKRAVESELITAIQAVARGEMYIHPAMTRALLDQSTAKSLPDQASQATLTAREYEVLRLIAQGNSNRQVASLLTISVRTVESHRANLMEKLNLTCRVDLVRYAAQHGMLEDWEPDMSGGNLN